MRLLIDECADERLRFLFPGYDCQTARFANLAGLKNGDLLEAAEAAGFVADLLQPGDLMLAKGSRGVKMERIVEGLDTRFVRANAAPVGRGTNKERG